MGNRLQLADCDCIFWTLQDSLRAHTTAQENRKRDLGEEFKRLTRRESSGGMEWLGVWKVALSRALNFQISEPEIWQKSLFLRNFRDFPENFGL